MTVLFRVCCCFLLCTSATLFAQAPAPQETLVDAPGEVTSRVPAELPTTPPPAALDLRASLHPTSLLSIPALPLAPSPQSRDLPPVTARPEPYHWKGLILQSVAFSLLENSVRVMTADQNDRHLLLNKPFWSDYWASLGQFNMRRWNDGDSFPVNYIGHPIQGAISGYIEIQNDPSARELEISRNPAYWRSRFRAFLWATVYSTQSEIGPLGEASIFNEGGFTYPIRCTKNSAAPGGCLNRNATYTNNTGWVDFIITPTVGTLWLVGEDFLDRYIADPLVARHPNTFGYKVLRSGLNPSRSLANMLRGRYPWYRDEEHPAEYQSPVVVRFEEALDDEPHDHIDLQLFSSNFSLRTNHTGCIGCRSLTAGLGGEAGLAVRRYLDIVTIVRYQPNASPVSSLNIGGSLLAANFGLRSGYSGQHFALKAELAPGFASYSYTTPSPTDAVPVPHTGRNFNFSALADISGDLRLGAHFALRASVEQMLIRYKSPDRDPPGIGAPPRLTFLSHDNYINSTNWGFRVGPVFRF